MKKYLIALDLDGTLLYDWQTLKDETKDFLMDVKSKGHELVIATGRPYRSSIEYYNRLELDTPLINYNGGLITWKNNPEFEEVNVTVDRDAVIDIFNKNEAYIRNAFCEIKDDIYVMENTEEIQPLLHFFNGARLFSGSFEETLPKDEGANGFIIVANKHQGQHIEEYVKKHYPNKLMTRNWGNEYEFIIELYTPKTNKGIALKHVADTLGFKREDVIAFGDGHNDIEMLEYAGTGIAMNNAHEELLKVADIHLKESHQENGIEKYLKKII